MTVEFVAAHSRSVARWGDLDRAAGLIARRHGLSGVVPILAEPSLGTLAAVLAVWRSNGTVLMVPTAPGSGGMLASRLDLADLVAQVEASSVLVVGRVDPGPLELATVEVNPEVEVLAGRTGPATEDRVPVGQQVIAMQMTSGTTSSPKIVAVTGDMLLANHHAIRERFAFGDEAAVSWLPLYHDMGFFGLFALAARHDWPLTFFDSAVFARRPEQWLQLCSERGATLTASPPLGLSMAMARGLGAVDLTSLGALVVGADSLDARVLRSFIEGARGSGLSGSAVWAAYGMAEATLAVTAERVDLDALRGGVVSSGTPLAGTCLAVTQDGDDAEGIGRLRVAGPSVTSSVHVDGRWQDPRQDGWFQTGDLCEIEAGTGRLWVHGRVDDSLNVGGVLVNAAELEARILREVHGLLEVGVGQAVVRGRTRLVVCVRPRLRAPSEEERQRLRRQVAEHLRPTVGVVPWVTVVTRGLPRTSSGKLQRRLLSTLVRS